MKGMNGDNTPIQHVEDVDSKDVHYTCHQQPVSPLTGVCLVVAVGLTQDLALILSTKKHQTKQKQKQKQNKNAKKPQEFIYCKRGGIHCEEYRLCATASNNILENAIGKKICCVTASLIVKKICCVLLPALM